MADDFDRKLLAEVASNLEHIRLFPVGDSPIEQLFSRALRASAMCGISDINRVEIVGLGRPLDRLLAERARHRVVVVPQAQLPGWRVDFLIYAWDFGSCTGVPQWRELIVECDGHDFHERTKEQAKKDRGRDRNAQLRGRSILRFTGSEIHADPIQCALQVSMWAMRGWTDLPPPSAQP